MIVAPATVTVTVTVGIAIITVVLERINVCDVAPGEGTGFGSEDMMSNGRMCCMMNSLHGTLVKVGAGGWVI